LLTCVLVVSDGFKVQSQAAANIDQRVEQLQTRIEQSRNNPEISAKAKPEDFDNALKSIESQAYTAAENARNSVTKSSIVIASNFLIVGVGLLSLGRFGIGSSLNKSSHGRFKVRRA
jgi:predicted PurR-regulated permease PerM